ncbi:GspE/PulE family protein [Desulfurivibrio dismutans]|uniref:GspE/PulE family protein n=1 Tax=Desulfurivibrio dismutans TaxID=1398908 RepID=UPI0023DA9A84|nr:GspE/PulE family protein [Desulfurivibrio alkaliphilus]MDF1615488.1 GspE/PulE family protein [Desulfurivibrio alkaliphilus]
MGQKYNLDFRVATCPAISGENVTIRILDSRNANVGLEKLNHSPHVLDPFKIFLKSAAGMVLVTGPTGSGKSSTLYGALQYIYDPTLKIITAEDPIEYSFPGIMQTQINNKIGLSFSQLLRSFLRLDPDVILVGEIRDGDTAQIGFDAAQTGHLVLSTLHTNDAISTLGRLDDLGIDRAQIAASLSCVLAQRLVRRICPTCLADYVPSEEEWSPLFSDYPTHLTFFKGEGCSDCDFTGFSGRTLLSELFVPSDFKSFNKGAGVDELKAEAIESGRMKTMVDDGLLKLGDTTISEILRVVPHEMIQMFRKRGSRSAPGAHDPGPASSTGRGRGFMITDPATEGIRIDQMYEEYLSLAAIIQDEEKIDRELFHRFVTDNFQDLTKTTGSHSILFNFENADGGVRITAVPLD